KLKATVTLDEEPDGYRWVLCAVDEYFKKGNNEHTRRELNMETRMLKVLEFRKRRTWRRSPELIGSLLGREVHFAATKSAKKDDSPTVIRQVSAVAADNLNSTQYGAYFKVEVEVEYIGCTDEHGNTIVWSDQLEFMVDAHALFKGL
ncbi:hypothetical protein OSTOST_18390, partial [Ostertagia ostertagi]